MVKYFIDNINCTNNLFLYDELRNDDSELENPNTFYATLSNQSDQQVLYGNLQVLSRSKPRSLQKRLLECDVIIFDLHYADLEEVEARIKFLREAKLESNKVLIVISNVLVWGNTPKKQEIYEELKNQAYEDNDFLLRKAYPKYEGWKTIENLTISAGLNKENLDAYVVCSGILYGKGEEVLEYHFRSAWINDPLQLPYLDTGENWIPMIYIADLARLVKHTSESLPESHYLIAADNSQDQRQINIVKSISREMGAGEDYIASVKYEAAAFTDWAEPLSIDIYLKPSQCFLSSEIKWECFDGLPSNMKKLNEEFNLYRDLKPVRVWVTGPPAVGKTYFSKKLVHEYNIPHINIPMLVDEFQELENDLGLYIKQRMEEVKQEAIEEAERTKKKNQEIDHSKINPRIPEDLIGIMLKWKLTTNSCRNRGFILDGWPKNYEQTKKFFLIDDPTYVEPPIPENDENYHPPKPPQIIDQTVLPDHAILLKAPNDYLIQRVKNLPEAETIGTHFNDEGMKRRLQIYREANGGDKGDKGQTPVHAFFTEIDIPVLEIDVNTLEENQILENIQQHIERNGRYFNYQISDDPIEPMLEQESGTRDQIGDMPEERQLQDEEEQEADMEELLKLEQAKMRERELLETRSQPFRHYLMENVIPTLSDALLDICQTIPENPVQYLIEYIEKVIQEKKTTEESKSKEDRISKQPPNLIFTSDPDENK